MTARPRIAIPVPHSQRPDYAQRSLPQYIRAIESSEGEAVVIQLDQPAPDIAAEITKCQAVLLPGSSADVDPQKYNAARGPHTAAGDALRDAADELLLQDAHNMGKPIFGICYGLQSLNVWRSGTLVQDISSLRPSPVNHEAREVVRAHRVALDPASRLADILHGHLRSSSHSSQPPGAGHLEIEVNSSHHQAPDVVGDGLLVAARCPQDGIIEALEGADPAHFVLGVQWHPERGFDDDVPSRLLFRAFIDAAKDYAAGNAGGPRVRKAGKSR